MISHTTALSNSHSGVVGVCIVRRDDGLFHQLVITDAFVRVLLSA